MLGLPRLTPQTVAVLRALLATTPGRGRYGRDIAAVAGLQSGTLHPILARLQRCGVVESRWEDPAAVEAGRPRRRYYWLTGGGADAARAALAPLDE